MHGAGGKFEMGGAHIGGEIDDGAALLQRVGERLRREQMPAGSAGREQHQRRRASRHQIALPAGTGSGAVSMAARGCSRVNASSMPMA